MPQRVDAERHRAGADREDGAGLAVQRPGVGGDRVRGDRDGAHGQGPGQPGRELAGLLGSGLGARGADHEGGGGRTLGEHLPDDVPDRLLGAVDAAGVGQTGRSGAVGDGPPSGLLDDGAAAGLADVDADVDVADAHAVTSPSSTSAAATAVAAPVPCVWTVREPGSSSRRRPP